MTSGKFSIPPVVRLQKLAENCQFLRGFCHYAVVKFVMAILDMMMTILCDTYVASGAATQLLGRHTTDRDIEAGVAGAAGAAVGSAEAQEVVAIRRPPVAVAACVVERARVVVAAQHKIGR